MFTPGHLALYGLMSSLYFSTKSFMELLSKIASLPTPLFSFSECKSTDFFIPRQIFSEIFLSRKKSRLGNAKPFALVLKWLRRTTADCFFSRFSYGAECKLRHFTPTRQIFLRKSFGIMLHNMLWSLKPGRRRLELGIAVRRKAEESSRGRRWRTDGGMGSAGAGQMAAWADGWQRA